MRLKTKVVITLELHRQRCDQAVVGGTTSVVSVFVKGEDNSSFPFRRNSFLRDLCYISNAIQPRGEIISQAPSLLFICAYTCFSDLTDESTTVAAKTFNFPSDCTTCYNCKSRQNNRCVQNRRQFLKKYAFKRLQSWFVIDLIEIITYTPTSYIAIIQKNISSGILSNTFVAVI